MFWVHHGFIITIVVALAWYVLPSLVELWLLYGALWHRSRLATALATALGIWLVLLFRGQVGP